MDIRTKRKVVAILRVLHEAGRPLGATRIAREPRPQGPASAPKRRRGRTVACWFKTLALSFALYTCWRRQWKPFPNSHRTQVSGMS